MTWREMAEKTGIPFTLKQEIIWLLERAGSFSFKRSHEWEKTAVRVLHDMYNLPPQRVIAAPQSVTTRSVPVPCEVCEKAGWRPTPFEEDNPEDEGMKCDACNGKGWLMVVETARTRPKEIR